MNSISPRKALNKAYLKVKPSRKDIEKFQDNLQSLLEQINEAESEEFHKNLISQFLQDTYYKPNHFINTKRRNDLVIHNSKDQKSQVGIILEIKKPRNTNEMLNLDNLNTKAFQELVLYFLRERLQENNLEIKYLVATNVYQWFIFDAQEFEKYFAQDKNLVKQFHDFEAGRLTDKKTEFFYREIARPAIENIQSEITFTHFDIREYQTYLQSTEIPDNKQLIVLYKLLSPEHLLKLPFVNDSNSLDKKFYSELLHIIGLTEIKKANKKLIQRQTESKRNRGSLIEKAIFQLDSLDKISRLEKPEQYGENYQEQLFNISLELGITWINRILFIKLLEAQLMNYHKGDRCFAFLNLEKVPSYQELNNLFFNVLARKYSDRQGKEKEIFAKVPYLNSSLFEPTEMEQQTIFISNLTEEKLPIFSETVLKDSQGKKCQGELNSLQYLFQFLNAYDFSSEGSEAIQEDNKTLINASVLGLIFEKINGYKDGSYFTPGFITMYMCRETISRAVVHKFNDLKSWNCQNIEQLYDKITDKKEANQIINSLKICDPAVGSGHFLVSALNEIIAIKSELKILLDRQGKTLRDYQVDVVNDELMITDDDGDFFEYDPNNLERQRVQETLFHEKQRIIENCLFGVDVNPNSVKICQLRLWIELLKNAYYQPETNYTELETLPNIDINIKCGNSLISRYDLDSDLRQALKKNKWSIESYRNAVQIYRRTESKQQKREMERLIQDIKGNFRTTLQGTDPKKKKLRNLEYEVDDLVNQNQLSLFEETKAEQKAREKKIDKLNNQIDKLRVEIEEIESGKVYENALEWRFEFPEVLNDNGDFVGFDVVIGNPPWGAKIEQIQLQHIKTINSDIIVRTIDSFMFFINLTFSLKSKLGIVCQIIPDVILYQVDNKKLRTKIFQKSQLEIAINLGDGIFEDVSRPSCIILMTSNISNMSLVGEYSISSHKKLSNHLLSALNTSSFLAMPNQIIATKNIDGYYILNRYKKTKLQELIDKDGIQRGVTPSLQKAFIIDEESINKFSLEKDLIFPTVTGGKDVRKYIVQDISKKIIYTRTIDSPESIPKIISYLKTFRSQITSKEVKEGKHPFWSLHRPRNKELFVKTEKIIGVITGDRIIVALDIEQIFPTDGLYVMATNGSCSNKFIVGVLNSKLLTYFYRLLSMETNRTLAQIKPTILKDLPIEFDDRQIVRQIESIVDQIITTKKSNNNADTTVLEIEIDQLVYQLYKLTEEEIKIVESKTT
ncbi:MAG: TaqI-like C-terminal specificity domain-containing protein [Cyanobacteriota bacterium]|nr:TaqI-like C-terminal specificity domain-containing protein [Cyanobacteriota bacterium]